GPCCRCGDDPGDRAAGPAVAGFPGRPDRLPGRSGTPVVAVALEAGVSRPIIESILSGGCCAGDRVALFDWRRHAQGLAHLHQVSPEGGVERDSVAAAPLLLTRLLLAGGV